MAERPTFSPFWHRVRAMAPRLRTHVQITRQHYRGRRWHVVQDPTTNQFYRLNPIAYFLVSLFDGKRSVEEAWNITLQQHGDSAPTQGEVIQLISQLYNSNLLSMDIPPETEQLLRRGRERFKQKAMSQAIGLMYFRVRLFNPDRLVSWVEPMLRPLLNRWGFLAWLAIVLAAFVNFLPHVQRFSEGFGSALAPSNWGWLTVVFIVTKAWHELGHGVICKRFGGQVPEFGVMMLVMLPAPYVDASAAWGFASKWKRMAVGAGGMIFELLIASAASVVWLNSAGNPTLHAISYNAILTASVSTLLFNANPLMRFDGYYILSDLIEVPNLMQRSTSMLKYLCQVYIYRVKDAVPPTSSRTEAWILFVYGVAAMVYRVVLFFSITLYVMGKMFAIGLVLAVWTAAMWFMLPVGKFVHWLATSSQIMEFRGRAIATSLALVVLGLALVGAVPAPDHRRGSGVVESEARAGVFAGTAGFVGESLVRPGDRVREGDVLVRMFSPELDARIDSLAAELAEARSMERAAIVDDPASAQVAAEKVRTLEVQIAHLRDERAKLDVRATQDGVVVGGDPETLVGSYLDRGTPLCELVGDADLRVTALMTQREAAWLFELSRDRYDVEMRLRSDVPRVIDGGEVRVIDAGQLKLPHAALGFAGGGKIEIDEKERSGLLAKDPQFVVYVHAPEGRADELGRPGERVALRFTLPDRPLLSQWVDRLHKMVQGRVNL
ncbi:MAG: PqqD family peptide modification chaperone [Phycisphaerales bacterium]|jgi:putative peptide zinc metalloprotease protein|nr:PqqD family peptide modification chaperone [Phycisphaerales bacterium]